MRNSNQNAPLAAHIQKRLGRWAAHRIANDECTIKLGRADRQRRDKGGEFDDAREKYKRTRIEARAEQLTDLWEVVARRKKGDIVAHLLLEVVVVIRRGGRLGVGGVGGGRALIVLNVGFRGAIRVLMGRARARNEKGMRDAQGKMIGKRRLYAQRRHRQIVERAVLVAVCCGNENRESTESDVSGALPRTTRKSCPISQIYVACA